MSGNPLPDLLTNALVGRSGVGKSVAVHFDGIESRVHPVDQEGLHGQHVSVPDGM